MARHFLFGKEVEGKLDITAVLDQAEASSLEQVPVKDIVELLDSVGEVWRDPESVWRKRTMEEVGPRVGFSPQMMEQGMSELSRLLDRSTLMDKLRHQLIRSRFLDGWVWREGYNGYLRAFPLGIVTHVSPGNVFLGAADSLVHGLLTKNINLLKVASADPLFPLLFADSIRHLDVEGLVSKSFAILAFDRNDEEVEKALKERSQGIVVWGGRAAVDAWSRGVGPGTRVVPYGPRFSFAVVSKAGLETANASAEAIALDTVMWEQRACASPQVLFLQECDEMDDFLGRIAAELELLSVRLPAGELELDQKIEIRKERELCLEQELRGQARCWGSDGKFSWSLLRRPWDPHRQNPLNRTLVVVPYQELPQLITWLTPYRHLLQSAGLGVGREQVRDYATRLASIGVTRVTELGRMYLAKHGAPHDGSFQLGQLVRFATIESVAERFDPGKRLRPEPPSKTRKLAALVRFARARSPFYKRHLPALEINEARDISRLPLLDSESLRLNTPPVGEELLTAPFEGAYVFASGGSTGAPKFSLFSYEEWEEVTDILAAIYETAGVKSGDTVGNLFMAGNLWTSFLAASEALEKLGCVTLPIAGNADPAQILRYLELFSPSVLLGLPSLLIRLAEQALREKIQLKVRTILYGGEHLAREAREFLRRALGAEVVLSAGYASVDAGPIGFQNPDHQGGVHQLLYDYQFLEFVDPDTEKPVASGEVGEIVVTCMRRRLMPLIRYRTGDLGRWVDENDWVFELKGRVGDRLRVGTADLYPHDVARALDRLDGVSRLFQLVVSKQGVKDHLKILVERNGLVEPPDNATVKAAVRELSPELDEALNEGWLADLEIEILEVDGLPRVPRTGKIRRIVDQR